MKLLKKLIISGRVSLLLQFASIIPRPVAFCPALAKPVPHIPPGQNRASFPSEGGDGGPCVIYDPFHPLKRSGSPLERGRDTPQRACQLGADFFLIKPSNTSVLTEMMKAVKLCWLTFNQFK